MDTPSFPASENLQPEEQLDNEDGKEALSGRGSAPSAEVEFSSSADGFLASSEATDDGADENGLDEGEEWEDVEEVESGGDGDPGTGIAEIKTRRVRRRKRQPKLDALELRLIGRRALCKRIADIAPYMLRMVKARILHTHLESKRGLEDDDLTKIILSDAAKLAERKRILDALNNTQQDFARGDLKAIIFEILLQEETFSIAEHKLDERVIDYEKGVVKSSKAFSFEELKRSDPERWHHLDTYRIVLDAAWRNDNSISADEANLLAVLRDHLNVTAEDHWVISALMKRFPKEKCALHTPDEVNEARKELQRQGLLWNYKNEDDQNIDVIPFEIAEVIRKEYAGQELQAVNYRRLMSHDNLLVTNLRAALQAHGLDRAGNKADLIERIVTSGIKPSEVLSSLDKEKLSSICGCFGLKTSGAKSELIERIIGFYDDLTFEVRVSKDPREEWYANYELLARRAYAELRAKKLIVKDLDIEHMFEDATAFLFQARLHVPCDMSRKDHKADGRLPLDNNQCILLDCKSAESAVNLQDYLEHQFDAYLRRERELGKRQPLGFIVIAPAFTPQSISLATKYKATTNWDVAMITADAIKHLADRWVAAEPEKPFPVRLLIRTDLIDKERAEFLLSLA
jgi:hypothetical protein